MYFFFHLIVLSIKYAKINNENQTLTFCLKQLLRIVFDDPNFFDFLLVFNRKPLWKIKERDTSNFSIPLKEIL